MSWAFFEPLCAGMCEPMRRPARVLRIITRMNIGGPAVHARVLSTHLDPAAYATTLIVGESEPGEGDLTSQLPQQVHVIRVVSLRRRLHVWTDLCAFMRLVRLIQSMRPDIIHTHMAKAGCLGRLAGLAYNRWGIGQRPGRRAILVHTFHGHVLEGYFSAWKSSLFVRIERWLARRTDCLIAVSPAIREALLQKGIGRPEQWRIIRLGLDLSELARLPLPESSTPVRFGIVGRLVPIKNPGLFLEAVRQVAERRRGPLHGVIVGDGPLRDHLEGEVRRLGLEGIVQFAGWQQDLQAVYRGLDATCLTSWNEGTPVALIEAMAAGRAVVATDVGGVRDLLDDDGAQSPPVAEGEFLIAARGILVRPGDAEGFSAALTALAENPELRQRLGAAARASVVVQYAQDRLTTDMTELYQSLQQRRAA